MPRRGPLSSLDRRIGLLFAGTLALLAIAGLRTAYLGVVKGASLRQAATAQQVTQEPVPAPRGTISDRKGIELAVSEPADDVAADPLIIKDPLSAARRIAPPLRQPVDQVLKKLSRRDTGFVYLARQLPSTRSRQLRRLHLEGLQFTPATNRTYPQRSLAGQLLGTVGTDGHGLAGVELVEDRILRGHDGRRRVVKDALGQPISFQDQHTAKPGTDVRLTIDSAIQNQAEQALNEVGKKFSPRGAMALVMDPRTGELLAMANWPRVDANRWADAPDYARENRAVGAAYEPGSTFKSFTVAGALTDGKVTPETSFNLAPQIQVADRTIGEAHARDYETLTTAEILAQSSNVGAVTIAAREGSARFDQWVRAFGFGSATGIGLPGEGTGIVPRLQDYSGSSMGNLPIGQGLAVTPLQMASAYAAIANGGILRTPRILMRARGKAVRGSRGRRVISPQVASSLRQMLQGVLAPGGTASEVSIPGYQLAGKTGTANKPDPISGGYSDTKFVASFVGFAPARDPRLLVAVMVDEPQGETYGGAVAAPAFQKIASFALPYLGIAPN
ncbi:MAG: penicillin-binding protein 2 [Actinomycetota bacterium]|nr:penicillin-binding protein 2 [Actinomycetota bacterium]